MSIDELKRQRRVTDQMLTMYSVLRDRYARRAKLLTLGILASAVALCACTFLPAEALSFVGLGPWATKLILGVFSGFVLFLSIVELCVSWRDRSHQYAEAAERLAGLKTRYRDVSTEKELMSPSQIAEMTKACNAAMENLPRVPDSQFAALKAYHLKKVRLSQMIDAAVGCPVWLLRMKLFLEGLRGAWRNRKGETGDRCQAPAAGRSTVRV